MGPLQYGIYHPHKRMTLSPVESREGAPLPILRRTIDVLKEEGEGEGGGGGTAPDVTGGGREMQRNLIRV